MKGRLNGRLGSDAHLSNGEEERNTEEKKRKKEEENKSWIQLIVSY